MGGQVNKELIVVAESIITDTYTDQIPAFKTKSFGKSNYTLIIKGQQDMTLNENEVIVGSSSGGIPLDIKDITVFANAPTPVHDGANGDKISVVDALAMEQYLVGQLNAHFE